MFKNKLWFNGLLFAGAMWLFSRIIIALSMLVVSPLMPAPEGGVAATFSWQVFSAWDSIWYQSIVNSGYEYLGDGKRHSVAFFPLFPLIIRSIMACGLSFEVAGTLVNNVAFLGALIVLYAWIDERHGSSAARWTTAVLAWCPFSLFGTVVYTEGLYLLFSTTALWAFDTKQYGLLSISGAIATAIRPTGIALIPAFLLATWQQRRGVKALLASLATSGGLCLYSLYCRIQFGDAFAFLNAQKGWRSSLGFDSASWWNILLQIVMGTTNWQYGYLKDPWYPLLLTSIIAAAGLLWWKRKHLGEVTLHYAAAGLGFFLMLLASDPLSKVIMIFGGAYLLWRLRTGLSPIVVIYGFCGIGLLLASGGTISLNRLAYGIVSLSIALGVVLAHHRRWGFIVMGLFAMLLTSFALRFSQNLWVA